MQKIGDSTDTADVAGEFTEGNPAGGIPATHIKANWLNSVQRELIQLIVGSGLAVNAGDDTQVYRAVQRLAKAAAEFSNIGGKPTTLGGYGITDAYTQTQVNNLLAGKAPKATTLSGYGITDAYTQTQVGGLLAGKADKAATLSGYGITDAYTQVQVGGLLAGKADKAATLSGYGITDGLKRGEAGLGAAKVLSGSIDVVGQPGGFYAFSSGTTSFAQYSALVNLPYVDDRYGAQIGLVFGNAEPKLAFRICDQPGVWGATRYAWHDGNFDPATKADKSTTYTQSQVNILLAGKAPLSTTLGGYGIADAYTQTQVNSLLAAKAAKATTISGYGITDAFTKSEALSVANIASHADVNAGVRNDMLVSALKLLNGAAISKAPNGSVKLPDWLGGFVFQWGNVAPVPAAGTTITFPVAFPNTVVGVFPSIITPTPDDYEIMVSNVTPQNFVLRSYAVQIPNAYWFAIGY